MARIDFTGLDDVIARFEKEGTKLARLAPQALKAGGEILAERMRDLCPKDSGQLARHIRVEEPKGDAASGYYVDVLPYGTRRAAGTYGGKSQPYTRIAFVLEHGRSNMAARPFMQPAADQCERAITEAMREVLTRDE